MNAADLRRARRARLLALHRWAGLLAGLLMCPVFLWGTVAVWEPELDLWMRPAITTRAGAVDTVRAAALAEALLRASAAPAADWRVELPGARSAAMVLEWCRAGTCRRDVVDAGTGARTGATSGGALFARLHYALAAGPIGEILVGLAGLHFLAVIASGLWIHLRRMLSDLFRLRLEAPPAKRLRDAHVLTAVATLPFMTVATYSGVLLFAFLTLPAAWQARYGADRAAFFAERGGAPPGPASAVQGPARDALGLAPAVRRAETVLGAGRAGWITAPGTGAVEVLERDGATLPLRRRRVAVAADGSIAADPPGAPQAAVRLERWFYGIHFARWGGCGIRALYTANGLLATGAIGFALFLPGLRARRGGSPWRRIERAAATVATAGAVPATVAPLWVDRLLPRGTTAAAPFDVGAVAVAFVLAALVAARAAAPARVLLGAGAAGTLALPLLDVATAPAGAPLLGPRAAVDLAAIAIGAVCLRLALWRRA